MSSTPTADTAKVEHQRFENIVDKPLSEFEKDVERYHLTLRGKRLTAALAFVAGTGFTLFGFVAVIVLGW